MPRRLKDLVVTKVSLVPQGSNPDADVTLFKGAPEPVAKTTFAEVLAGNPPAVQEALWKIYDLVYVLQSAVYTTLYGGGTAVEDVTASVDQFKEAVLGVLSEVKVEKETTPEHVAALKKTVIEKALGFMRTLSNQEATVKLTTITKEALEKASREDLIAHIMEQEAPATDPTSPEAVLKAHPDLPEAVQAVLKAAQDNVASARADAAEALRIAKDAESRRELAETTDFVRKTFPNLPGTAEEIAKGYLDAKHAMSKEAFETYTKAMTAANAALAKTMVVKGEDEPSEGLSPYMQLMAKADDIKKSQPTLTDAQAFDKAVQANPDLYAAHRKAQRQVSR